LHYYIVGCRVGKADGSNRRPASKKGRTPAPSPTQRGLGNECIDYPTDILCWLHYFLAFWLRCPCPLLRCLVSRYGRLTAGLRSVSPHAAVETDDKFLEVR
jgi:hypothetical protein